MHVFALCTFLYAVHSRQISSLSSDPSENSNKGWVFFAGNGLNEDSESKSEETLARMAYRKVEYSIGHAHSFGYGTKKRSMVMGKRDYSTVGEEIAELDDNVIEWQKFKVFHTKNVNRDAINGKGWNVMRWNEESLQNLAENTRRRKKRGLGTGAISATVLSIMIVAILAFGVVAYAVYRRHKRSRNTTSVRRSFLLNPFYQEYVCL